MNNKKTKVYIYTRVSTVMQIDGYSLEAQKNKMKIMLNLMILRLQENMKMQESQGSPLREEWDSIR